jgi:LEA14-like dessication related protein
MLRRIALVLSTLALAACFNAQAPKVSVADVDVKSLGLFEQRFDISLRVGNPNDFDLAIEALDFDLEVNGPPSPRGLPAPPR